VRVPPTDATIQPVQWQSTAHFETDSESDSESASGNDLVKSEAPNSEQVSDKCVKNKDEIILDDDDDVKVEVKPAATSVDDGCDGERDTAPIEPAPDRQRVLVQRARAIDKSRHLLPILADEQRIVEAINEHDVCLASSCLPTRA
jgi:HrpA-like RNA helicase